MGKSLLFAIAALLVYTAAKPQAVCTGNWGPPVVNLTFGQGNNTGNWYGPLQNYAPGVSTSTIFVDTQGPPSGSLDDGYSGLVTNSQVGRPEWLNHTDHTGNPNGLMFLINAPSTASTVFFKYVMQNLCPNTFLKLSIWVLNVDGNTVPTTVCGSSYQAPNVTLQIVDPASQQILGSSNTDNIPLDGAWHQYSIEFTNGNDDSVELQIINNSVGSGCGNDLALDDITVQICQPQSLLLPQTDTTVYPNTPIPFKADVEDSNNVFINKQYQWQCSSDNGNTWIPLGSPSQSPDYTFDTAQLGTYLVRYIVGSEGQTDRPYCVAYSQQSTINVVPFGTIVDSIHVFTQNNVPPQINTMPGTLQLLAEVYPATANQQVTWSITPKDGMATIDANGLVTAVSGGQVWAKATSVGNPAKSDSILITICSTKFDFTVYPNPVQDKLNFNISVPCNADIYTPPTAYICNYVYPPVVQIISGSTGGVVYSQTLSRGASSIPVGGLATGVYYIQINAALYQSRVRFIKK